MPAVQIFTIEKKMKRKNYHKGLLLGLLTVSITARGNADSPVGKWVQPVPGLPGLQQGFELEEGGKASSVNMATLRYETWQQTGNRLILTGKSIGNRQTIPFSDTLNIERLTPDSLILTKGRLTLRYAREQSGNTAKASESIPASKIVPAKQMKVMKGRLRIGPEVRSFIPEGSGEAYWIVDATGELYQKYDKTTGGVKNGTVVYAELQVEDMGKSKEGFAADYPGVFKVHKVIKIKK